MSTTRYTAAADAAAAIANTTPHDRRIEVSSTVFGMGELSGVENVILSGQLTHGPRVLEFESMFARLQQSSHAIACNSGTSALHLALLALDICPFDTVIVPALTYVATANAAIYCRARVVPCDIDPNTWCIDAVRLRETIDGVRAVRGVHRIIVIPVHLYDTFADMESIYNLDRVIEVVEDSAHTVSPYPLGTPRSVARCHSFFASKIIACGEGGAVVTDDDRLASSARLFRGQGAPTRGVYHHTVVGYNYRMQELSAAVGIAQLHHVKMFLSHRRAIINRYRTNLSLDSRFTLQEGVRADGWMFAILLPRGVSRERVANRLDTAGISTRPFFEPLDHTYITPLLPCPVASDVSERGICLPTHCGLSFSDIDRVCEQLTDAVKKEISR